MSQRAFEAALGKLICDDAFRREFCEDAEGSVTRTGFQLTPIELSSLRRVNMEGIEAFVGYMDNRVLRAEEPATKRSTVSATRGRLMRSHGR